MAIKNVAASVLTRLNLNYSRGKFFLENPPRQSG